jgi:hypothetical protein
MRQSATPTIAIPARLAAARLDADRRHIGAVVVVGAGALEERPALGAAEPAGPLDHVRGALHGLDRDDVAVTHADRLTDLEIDDAGEQRPAEADVRVLTGRRRRRGHDAVGGEVIGDVRGRIDELDSAA